MEDATKAATAAFFGATAARYRERGLPAEEQVRALVEALGCPPGGRVLDAGCGAGNHCLALALRGYRVRGIDLSPAMIAQAREAARELELGEDAASFNIGDIEQLEELDAGYDGVICHSVLDFAPHPAQALAEFWRVLRPGGRLVLATIGAYSPIKYQFWRRFLPDSRVPAIGNGILPWEVEALLQHLGWRIVAQRPEYVTSYGGATNRYTEEDGRRIADPVWQQTIATVWHIVAEKPDAERGAAVAGGGDE